MSRLQKERIPDYDTVVRLKERLHRRIGGEHVGGAAVLVGSGFSYNAERLRDDAERFPSWVDLAKHVRDRLGEDPKKPLGVSEMLALFQMYEFKDGRAGLEDLLEKRIPDKQHVPGPLHLKLLQLPWSDVFTTNWDTLLERAADAPRVRRRYTPVTLETDVSRAPGPRIVKLHGGLPNVGHIIVTEEDYRTYGERHAPFVDMARMSLMENAFCLLGYSSDDPNFIQWHGWVRDRLRGYANRPTLVTITPLTPARRMYLENKGLSIVDLSPLVAKFEQERMAEDAKTRALDCFLDDLADDSPISHAWPEIYRPSGSDQDIATLKPHKKAASGDDRSNRASYNHGRHDFPECLSGKPRKTLHTAHNSGKGTQHIAVAETFRTGSDSDDLEEIDVWKNNTKNEIDRWKTMKGQYSGWVVLNEDNLNRARKLRWVDTADLWVRAFANCLDDALAEYPTLRVRSKSNATVDEAQKDLDWALEAMSLLVDMALLFRVQITSDTYNKTFHWLIKILTVDASRQPQSAAVVPDRAASQKHPRQKALASEECRKIEKRCRALALALARRLAIEGRHDLLTDLYKAIEDDPLTRSEHRRRDQAEALEAVVVGDARRARGVLDRLAAVDVLAPPSRAPALADPFEFAQAAALAVELGEAPQGEAMRATALAELQRMPLPSNDILTTSVSPTNSSEPRGSSYDYYLRSREAWARYARMLCYTEAEDKGAGQSPYYSEQEYLSDSKFLEAQAAFRCHAQAEFDQARLAAKAALKDDIAKFGEARSFAVLVDDAGVPVFKKLAEDLGAIACAIAKMDPDFALALGLRFLRGNGGALLKLGRDVFGGDHPGRTWLAARRFINSAGHLASTAEVDDAATKRIAASVEAAATVLRAMVDDTAATAHLKQDLLTAAPRDTRLADRYGKPLDERRSVGFHCLAACLAALERPFVMAQYTLAGTLTRLLRTLVGRQTDVLGLVGADGLFHRLVTMPCPGAQGMGIPSTHRPYVDRLWRGDQDPVLSLPSSVFGKVPKPHLEAVKKEVGGLAQRGDAFARSVFEARIAMMDSRPPAADPDTGERTQKK